MQGNVSHLELVLEKGMWSSFVGIFTEEAAIIRKDAIPVPEENIWKIRTLNAFKMGV